MNWKISKTSLSSFQGLIALVSITFIYMICMIEPVCSANNSIVGLYGVSPGASLATFKSQTTKAHIKGLRELSGANKKEISFKAKGLNIGRVRWSPEFAFVNDNGTYRLVCTFGVIPADALQLVLRELTQRYGRPHNDEEGYQWTLRKNKLSITLQPQPFPLHKWYELVFIEEDLWDEYVRGDASGTLLHWYERLMKEENPSYL